MTDRIKIEKLASAVYFITGFFTDNEPLKWKLRAFASDFVTSASYGTKDIGANILTLIRVAKNAGLISTDNYTIIDKEFTKYIDHIDEGTNISNLLKIETQTQTYQSQDSPINSAMPAIHNRGESVANRHEFLPIVSKDMKLKKFGAVTVKKNSRQSIIIALLKRKKEIMIKDISPLITGCSEKTVQRELLAMVRSGVLKKIGEKRWSRYTLA